MSLSQSSSVESDATNNHTSFQEVYLSEEKLDQIIGQGGFDSFEIIMQTENGVDTPVVQVRFGKNDSNMITVTSVAKGIKYLVQNLPHDKRNKIIRNSQVLIFKYEHPLAEDTQEEDRIMRSSTQDILSLALNNIPTITLVKEEHLQSVMAKIMKLKRIPLAGGLVDLIMSNMSYYKIIERDGIKTVEFVDSKTGLTRTAGFPPGILARKVQKQVAYILKMNPDIQISRQLETILDGKKYQPETGEEG